jgi:hypothetical protein
MLLFIYARLKIKLFFVPRKFKEENKKTCFLGDQEKKRIKKHVFLGIKKRRE